MMLLNESCRYCVSTDTKNNRWVKKFTMNTINQPGRSKVYINLPIFNLLAKVSYDLTLIISNVRFGRSKYRKCYDERKTCMHNRAKYVSKIMLSNLRLSFLTLFIHVIRIVRRHQSWVKTGFFKNKSVIAFEKTMCCHWSTWMW